MSKIRIVLTVKLRNLVQACKHGVYLFGWQLLILPYLLSRKAIMINSGQKLIHQEQSKRRLVLVFSVIEPSTKPLSYTKTRSIFTKEDRLDQTKSTLRSLETWDPSAQVVILELSPFIWQDSDVQKSYLSRENRLISLASSSPYKGLGQAMAFCGFFWKNIPLPHELWWLSGRYQIVSASKSDSLDNQDGTRISGVIANYSGGLLATTFIGFRGRAVITELADFLWQSRWKLLQNKSLEYVMTQFAEKHGNVIPRRDRVVGRVSVSGENVNQ